MLEEKGNYNYAPNKDVIYEIRDGEEYEKYTIVSSNGEEKEVEYWEVVFIPNDDITNKDERIAQYLSDNGVYGEVYTNSEGETMVSISWGDWKHDHAWCTDLMEYIGFQEDNEIETEENGSDCYSAEHYYSVR